MSRSRSRLAADWFAKLRVNAVTTEVEHDDVLIEQAAIDAVEAKAIVDAAAVEAIRLADLATAETTRLADLASAEAARIAAKALADADMATAIGNIPPSNNASALTTGTLPDGRFPATLPAVSGANLTDLQAVVTSATAPSSPNIGLLWIDTSQNPHKFKVYSNFHDNTSGWSYIKTNRKPDAAGITVNSSISLSPGGTADITFSGATDPDIGGVHEGTGLTWYIEDISNIWVTVTQASISNTLNPTFTFNGSSNINQAATFTYSVRVVDAEGLSHKKTGFSGSIVNSVTRALGSYSSGSNWYYNSGTISVNVGTVNVPSGMTLKQWSLNLSSASNYIDWIRLGGVTLSNGNYTSQDPTINGTWNIPVGNQTLQVGLYTQYEYHGSISINSWSFTFEG
jgi:hypothetical protein